MVERYYEIDTIKGIAVILMVIVHIFYLSTIMNVKNYNINGGILRLIAVISHTLFIFIVGMNLSINYQKYKLEDKDKYINKQIKRGLFLLGSGMILSLLTYLAFGNKYIRFGILHFIGISIILSTLIIHNKNLSIYIASVIGIIYTIINNRNIRSILFNKCSNTPFLCFITGLVNIKYTSIDHFPLIPYFGLICIGIYSGYRLYNNNKRLLFNNEIEKYKNSKINNILGSLGKNSFKIYVSHLLILYLVFMIYKRYNRVVEIDYNNLHEVIKNELDKRNIPHQL